MGWHDELCDELIEWWEDVAGSVDGNGCAVVLPVPAGWGRTTLLERVAARILDRDEPATVVCRVDGGAFADSLGVQVEELRAALDAGAANDGLRERLGVDTPKGLFTTSLSAADAFGLLGGRAGSLAAFALSLGIEVVHGRESAARSRRLADVERLAWRVASYSSSGQAVVVLVDDIEAVDGDVLDTFVTSTLDVPAARVLIVAAGAPEHPNTKRLLRRDRLGLSGSRIHRIVDVDPGMGVVRRLALVRDVLAGWPPRAQVELADTARDFADVFRVAGHRRAGDVDGPAEPPPGEVTELVKEARLAAGDPVAEAEAVVSPAAAAVAWTGGLLDPGSYDLVVARLGIAHDPHRVRRGTGHVRVDPAQVDVARAKRVLSEADRAAIRDVVCSSARLLAFLDRFDDPAVRLVDRVAVLGPLWELVRRGDVPVDDRWVRPLTALAGTRLALGDDAEARAVAEAVAAFCGTQGRPIPPDVLRVLDRAGSVTVEALPPGCVTGVEARVRYTCLLLRLPDRRVEAVDGVDGLVRDLDEVDDSGEVDSWRLELAARLVGADQPTLAATVVHRILTRDDSDPARQLALALLAGPVGELLVRRAVLVDAYRALTPATPADHVLTVADNLADVSKRLGRWRDALAAGTTALAARATIQGPDHPSTLTTRADVADWTGQSGDAAAALRLYTDLLPDVVRVLGADHPNTLTTRHNLAHWTGETGDAAAALRLYTDLLPDRVRVQGADHPDTLTTRSNIAAWTGRSGDAAAALRLFTDLLPDRVRVLGADHPDTLSTRNNIAAWTGETGDAAAALRLFTDLLPNRVRVQGADHPDTLTTRHNLAHWTGHTGDAAAALRLFTDLLPDRVRVLGANHPDTLNTRHNIAHWTGETGDAAAALRLFTGLLPDVVRVQGADHPDTVATRRASRFWQRRAGGTTPSS